jgi:tripartite-type tricarboxylate transporter receptor subunit TctC
MEVVQHVRSGTVRALAVTGHEETPDLPGVRTAEAQGYKVYISSRGFISAPAGTPKKVVDVLGAALKKAINSDENKKKLAAVLGDSLRYLPPEQAGQGWDEVEADIKPLLEQAWKK